MKGRITDPDLPAISSNLDENLRFLLIRVNAMVDDTQDYLRKHNPALLKAILTADDYIDNLKTTIESNCFSRLSSTPIPNKKEINRIRATQTICINLERIADFCTNITRQQGYLHDSKLLREFPFDELFSEIRRSLIAVLPALQKSDLGGALAICRTEFELDRLYKENFDAIRERLHSSRKDLDDLLTILFIFRYLERIGDSILNIGEALLLAMIGERIKIHQFQALQETLSKTGLQNALSEVNIRAILGSRSGCRISRVATTDDVQTGKRSQESIFKEGNPSKIRKEKENMERWQQVCPGLAPRVFSYHEDGGIASMLEEYLPGCPLNTIVLSSPVDVLDSAFFVLEETLIDVWERTRMDEPQQSNYLGQIQNRLSAIRQVHPSFFPGEKWVGSHLVPSMAELLEICQRIERESFRVPHTVFIHGDFNLNNVFYEHSEHRIHWIDLYRSRDDDYAKDISVMIVSNFRMPVFDKEIRQRLNWAMTTLYRFAEGYARDQGDRTFQARMALALARSFFTSTRFELNTSFAKEMFLRARYLLERVAAHQGREWEEFNLPLPILYL